jgi:uncharacterized protein YdeI (YjbR/CyaY-like superfamily)
MGEEIQKTKNDSLAKVDEGPKRFVEKGPHVIHDTKTGIYWLKKDSWQDKGKFFNWHESCDYNDKKNLRKIGGFDDWRMPLFDEAKTLYDQIKAFANHQTHQFFLGFFYRCSHRTHAN